MEQLAFNLDVEKVRTYFKTHEDLPDNLKYFINHNIDKNTVLYYFDINEEIVLYLINVYVTKPFNKYLKPSIESIVINKSYLVTGEFIKDVDTEKEYRYFDNKFNLESEDFDEELFEVFQVQDYDNALLYTDNLDDLKYTSEYKYSLIWELKDYYKRNDFNIEMLTYFPVYCKNFEYLIKMKLYNLAYYNPTVVNDGNSFISMFGVPKEYYDFMVEIDIKPSELEALRVYPTRDLNVLRIIETNPHLFQDLNGNVGLDKVFEYLKEQGLDIENTYEYYDYYRNCKLLGFDMKDKSVLFPNNLIEQHDKISEEMIKETNPLIDKKIRNISSILELNIYEDEEYIILPASSLKDLIDESSQMHNCVRTYSYNYSDNECQIYFMRHKKDLQKSFVTIEVVDNKVVQARLKYNELPSEDVMEVIRKWEATLLSVK